VHVGKNSDVTDGYIADAGHSRQLASEDKSEEDAPEKGHAHSHGSGKKDAPGNGHQSQSDAKSKPAPMPDTGEADAKQTSLSGGQSDAHPKPAQDADDTDTKKTSASAGQSDAHPKPAPAPDADDIDTKQTSVSAGQFDAHPKPAPDTDDIDTKQASVSAGQSKAHPKPAPAPAQYADDTDAKKTSLRAGQSDAHPKPAPVPDAENIDAKQTSVSARQSDAHPKPAPAPPPEAVDTDAKQTSFSAGQSDAHPKLAPAPALSAGQSDAHPKPAPDADDTDSKKASSEKETEKAKDMFSYHKELLPLDTMDWVSFASSGIGLIIAAGGGIGGGGILVPLYMILLQFRPKHAIALSNFTILGGSIANCLFNVQKTLPDGRSVIDWDIIVMMEPSTIAGAVLGSFASKYLPDFVLTASLSIVLAMLSFRTMEKGISMFRKESAKMAEDAQTMLITPRQEEARGLVNEQIAVNSERSTRKAEGVPWGKIMLLVLCFVGCVVFTVLKGSGHGSIIGVKCGSNLFWILSMASVPWTIVFGILFRSLLIGEYEAKVKDPNWVFTDTDIKWDHCNTIKYPLVCTLAGVFAGLFGVGGGIVKGPLMLEMGVPPAVAAATAAQMILFTTCAACASFEIFGLLEPEYGIFFFCHGYWLYSSWPSRHKPLHEACKATVSASAIHRFCHGPFHTIGGARGC
jgi:uncharacterized membrane protein YfcA